MEIGDAVQWRDGDILIVGEVIAIEDPVEGEPNSALAVRVIEAHAFHRTYGGSGAMRGAVHTKPQSDLEPCTTYKNTVKEAMTVYRRNPDVYDRQRAEIESAPEREPYLKDA